MIGIQHNVPALVLAPMEGVTDYAMRRFITERMPFLYCVSEFVRVSHEKVPSHTFLKHIPELKNSGYTISGSPVQIQLLGGDPIRLAESALTAVHLGAQGIDINFGCPAPTVNRHDGGATLLKYPERIYEILLEIRKAVPSSIPVSAKLRLGWDDPRDILNNAEKASKAGINWITIHARTRMQGYAPPVQWEWIKKVRENIDIPVIANGDIWTSEQFLRCRDVTGAEHFMLGRGALGNPILASQMAKELGIKHTLAPIQFSNKRKDWYPLVHRFQEVSIEAGGNPGYIPRRIKQWINLATRCREVPWFEDLKRMENTEEMLNYLNSESLEHSHV